MPYADGSVERRFLEDDPQALGQVIRWIALALTSPRFWLLRAEWPDLLQDVLARLVESLREERYDPARDLRTYVQGIARHTAMQAIERRMHDRAGGDTDPRRGEPMPDPERRATGREIVRRVLDLASEECRDLIRAYFFEDLSYAEIAGSLDVPVGTVKSRLFRCLEAAHFLVLGGSRGGNRRPLWRNKMKTEGPA